MNFQICTSSSKPVFKFINDMIYDISKSKDIFLSKGKHPIFLVDDRNIIKPLGEKFEDLGIVRDGSSRKKSFEKGYHHTEIVGFGKIPKLKYIYNIDKFSA